MRSILMALAAAAVSVSALAQSEPEFNEVELKAAFESHLKDADSAKFRMIKHGVPDGSSSARDLCGEVNSKNSYGAYSGYEPFLALTAKSQSGKAIYMTIIIGVAADVMCRKAGLR